MGSKRSMRAPGAIYAAAGAFALGLPATAVAFGVAPSTAHSSTTVTPAAVHMTVARRDVPYGRDVVVRGQAPAGQALELQFEPSDSHDWRSLAATHAGAAGRFTLRAPVRRSGLVRIDAAGAVTTATSARTRPDGTPAQASSTEQIEVGSRFVARPHLLYAVAGHAVTLRGRLLPGTRGRVVRLMAREGARWQTLARVRTGPLGGFQIRYTPSSSGTRYVRFSFAGDRANRSSWARAGEVLGMHYAVVSWYEDAGSTACGFHATYGVANLSLPCGTRVTFAYGGRVVIATVDDRGPYVGGREYDLNQNTSAALGMAGVATVLASK